MSIENKLEMSEKMSFDEIERYELPVSFNKLNELMETSEVNFSNSKIDELTEEKESLILEIDALNEKNEDLINEVEKLKGEVENVRDIQK